MLFRIAIRTRATERLITMRNLEIMNGIATPSRSGFSPGNRFRIPRPLDPAEKVEEAKEGHIRSWNA